MKVEQVKAYEVIEKRRIDDLDSTGYLLKHKKTGAKIALLSNEDDNKVFYIGFRTPPVDSTGAAHILEHSVLCGSRNFPVKDPFIELAKGSLNTFLNAMTYPDKTIYPVASCNDKDFQNLMHVYLDAVFYPNIYKEDKIFKQEGWHYEMENEEDELTVNGVVYNEMKGAFSSPDDVLDREILNSLFPDTAYGFESGGNPDDIPGLTYEQFLDFHGKYYHPSNSYIYLYGNMDMAEKLIFLDEEYLSGFEASVIDSEIELQKGFEEPVSIHREYSITENESEKENSYLSYNIVVGTSLDPELYIAFQVLDYVLGSAPGAPVKKALSDKSIGKDIYSFYENVIKQPYFSIVSKNTEAACKDEFVQTIETVLQDLRKNGLDKRALKAALNYYEFKYREADFGSYPKGLMYGLQILASWIYDENSPFIHIEANHTFESLKQKTENGYFEQVIEDYLLNNTHKSIVVIEPVKGLTTRKEQQLKKSLADKKAALPKEEIQQIVIQTRELREYQEEPNTQEDLEKIPLLNREDIKKEAEGFLNEEAYIDDTLVLKHNIFTNGIGYVKLLFFMDDIPKELFAYAGILKAVLGLMDTENYSYGDLFNEINIKTGGISTDINSYTNMENLEECRTAFEIKTKVLYANTGEAFRLMEEIILNTKLDDKKRFAEIMGETKSRVQANFMSAGHSLAAVRAMSYFSKRAVLSEEINGLPFYRLIEKIDGKLEQESTLAIEKLKELCRCLFRPENLMVDYTGTKEGYQKIGECVSKLKSGLYTQEVPKESYEPMPVKRNEGLMSSSQVQYVCRAGNYLDKGYAYTGALRVLRVIMGYDYLWNNVRVKGGAYGCMCNFGRSGDSYFVSYRDPNLTKTIETYEGAAAYIKDFEADERQMTQFIIGTVSDMDTPLNPAAKGARSLGAYLSKMRVEDVQKERDEVLGAGREDIRRLGDYLQAFMDADCLCAVGNEDTIKENQELFQYTEHLFN